MLPDLSPQSPPTLPQGLLLCALALPLDLLAFAIILSGHRHRPSALVLLVLHALASALAARGLHGMMPLSQQTPRREGLLFLFAVPFFLPLFGMLGLLGGVLATIYYPNQPPPPRPG